MVAFIITILKLIVILGVVTTIHEFGHFIFSKIFKIGVNEFSIGFGPKLFQKEFRGTKYSLRCIPLGGYCAIEGEDGDTTSKNSFANKNVFKKVIVLVMGATFNAILAICIFMAIAFSFPSYNTKITSFQENSVLEKAGLMIGDEIYSINGKRANIREDLLSQEFATAEDNVTIEYIRAGNKYTTIVERANSDIGYIGATFRADANGNSSNVIDMVASGGAAVAGELKAGDKIVSIEGIQTNTASDIVNIIRQNADKKIKIQIERNGVEETKELTPDKKRMFNLGIRSTEQVKTSLKFATYSSYNNVKTIIGSYVDLFRGKVGIQDMSGIVGIGEVVSKTSGFLDFLNLMGIISLAVGVANLIPFPPLDGGKVVIVIGEAITKKKISQKAEAIISYIGFGALILLTLVVTYNDILRII
ncbi:MAG: RIP metalloprotease RseP [Clostridia bacterium]|nr:RIP metalloprotease RseP [Clostridia bacterium]